MLLSWAKGFPRHRTHHVGLHWPPKPPSSAWAQLVLPLQPLCPCFCAFSSSLGNLNFQPIYVAAGTWLNHTHVSSTRADRWQIASQLPNASREHFDQPILTLQLMQANESASVICVPGLYLWPEAGDDAKHLPLDSCE